MPQPVYVLSIEGKPLFPTYRFGHVRKLLKTKRAHVVRSKPFQIQLNYQEVQLYETPENKKITLGIDPGRVNIGLAAVNNDGEVLYAAQIETRNKELICRKIDLNLKRLKKESISFFSLLY